MMTAILTILGFAMGVAFVGDMLGGSPVFGSVGSGLTAADQAAVDEYRSGRSTATETVEISTDFRDYE